MNMNGGLSRAEGCGRGKASLPRDLPETQPYRLTCYVRVGMRYFIYVQHSNKSNLNELGLTMAI